MTNLIPSALFLHYFCSIYDSSEPMRTYRRQDWVLVLATAWRLNAVRILRVPTWKMWPGSERKLLFFFFMLQLEANFTQVQPNVKLFADWSMWAPRMRQGGGDMFLLRWTTSCLLSFTYLIFFIFVLFFFCLFSFICALWLYRTITDYY